MKPFSRFSRFHLSVAFFLTQITVSAIATEKPASPESSVLIDNIEITAVRFPALSGDEETKMEELLKSTFPGKPLTVSLDRLITSVQASQEKAKPVAGSAIKSRSPVLNP
jgi:hypothetical protein